MFLAGSPQKVHNRKRGRGVEDQSELSFGLEAFEPFL